MRIPLRSDGIVRVLTVNGTHRRVQVGVWVLAFFVFLIALFGYLAWTKPD